MRPNTATVPKHAPNHALLHSGMSCKHCRHACLMQGSGLQRQARAPCARPRGSAAAGRPR